MWLCCVPPRHCGDLSPPSFAWCRGPGRKPILLTVLPPLSPGFQGRGGGGEGQFAWRWRVGPNLRVLPRVPTLTPRRRERVFGGATPSSPALLPREARGRREPEGFKFNERCCHYERNESGLRRLIRFNSPWQALSVFGVSRQFETHAADRLIHHRRCRGLVFWGLANPLCRLAAQPPGALACEESAGWSVASGSPQFGQNFALVV